MSGEAPNPIVLRYFRGEDVEKEHRAAVAVVSSGGLEFDLGDIDHDVFVRSGAKFFQATAALATGMLERYRLGRPELALMCASHGGEPRHVAIASQMLERGHLGVDALDCGPHAPLGEAAARELESLGRDPTPLHNNCSGKHAGMLLAALRQGEPTDGYLDADHPHQIRIREVVGRMSGVEPTMVRWATDGCSAPTMILPLRAAAEAFRRFGDREGDLSPHTRTLHAAIAAEPDMIAGADRFCTALARVTEGRVVGKIGADGFYGVCAPAAGLGLAVHVDDGGWDASERVALAVIERFGLLEADELAQLGRWREIDRVNCAGRVVGRIEASLDS